MQTYGKIDVYQGGVELWGDEEADYIRCAPIGLGSLEVELPDAEEFVGRHYTIRHLGSTTNVLVNPDGDHPGQTIEGSTNTYTIAPGGRITLQAIHYGYGSTQYGWEIVAA